MATDERKDLNRFTADETHATPAARRDDWSAFWHDPIGSVWRGDAFRRWTREMDRWFHDTENGRGSSLAGRYANWTPDIETFQRGDELVVRADLPGMKKDEITLQIADDTLTIEGERQHEHEEERDGYFRTERSYGRFCRVIPLPEGALSDSAKATFKDGVLEIVMHAPPKEVARGRRLEISDTPSASTSPAADRASTTRTGGASTPHVPITPE